MRRFLRFEICFDCVLWAQLLFSNAFWARVAIYVSDQHVSAVTNSSGQINTEFFTDLNSLTPSDTLNGQEANYGITTDGITYQVVGDGESTLRNVVKFETVWKYGLW